MTLLKSINRFTFFLGAIALIVLVFLAIALGYVEYINYSIAPSGKLYAEQSIRDIVSTWSEDELIKRTSPEFRAVTTQGQLDTLFHSLKNLGYFQSDDGLDGRVGVTFNISKGIIINATYNTTATFKYGRVDITLKLISHNNIWQIAGFHVVPK